MINWPTLLQKMAHIVTATEHWNNADIINLLDQQSADTNFKKLNFASQSVDRTQCTRNSTYVRTPKKAISGRFSCTTSGRKLTRSIMQQLSFEFYPRRESSVLLYFQLKDTTVDWDLFVLVSSSLLEFLFWFSSSSKYDTGTYRQLTNWVITTYYHIFQFGTYLTEAVLVLWVPSHLPACVMRLV